MLFAVLVMGASVYGFIYIYAFSSIVNPALSQPERVQLIAEKIFMTPTVIFVFLCAVIFVTAGILFWCNAMIFLKGEGESAEMKPTESDD